MCCRQLYAPVDRISSNVRMETVSWAADSVTASETAPTAQTKSTAKTVRALRVCLCGRACVCSFTDYSLIILRHCQMKKQHFSVFYVSFRSSVCVCVCFLMVFTHFPGVFLQRESSESTAGGAQQTVYSLNMMSLEALFILTCSQYTSGCPNASFSFCAHLEHKRTKANQKKQLFF